MLVTMGKIMYRPNPKLAKHRKDHGFTLIELMITVLIIGILTTTALPAFRGFIANQRIKSASFDTMAMMVLARSEAIKRNAQINATPTGSNWANGWTVTDNNAVTLSQQAALPGLTITCSSSTTCSAIIFNSNGRSSSSQSIQISSNSSNSVRCISIDLSGRPNSKKGNC